MHNNKDSCSKRINIFYKINSYTGEVCHFFYLTLFKFHFVSTFINIQKVHLNERQYKKLNYLFPIKTNRFTICFLVNHRSNEMIKTAFL